MTARFFGAQWSWCMRRGARMRFIAVSLLLAASLLAPNAHGLSLGGFKNSLVTFLLEKISVPGQFEVSADEVQSPASGVSVLKGLRVSDARGVWFRAGQLSFSWSASKLLLGQVQINEISIERADLQRLPQVAGEAEPQPAKPASSAAWPRSPIAVNIAKIAITAMRVSAAVFPQEVTFDAAGTLRDEGDEQSLTLAVKRVDSVAGDIDFSYLKRFSDDRLTLKLLANEAPGGLTAKAASLPADVAAMLDIQGSGTPAQWDGRLKLNVDGLLSAQGTLAASWLQRIGVNLAGSLTTGPRLAQAPRLAIGEQANFALLLQENDSGVVLVEQAQIDAKALRLVATGSFDRRRSLLDLAMDAAIDKDGAQRLSVLLRPMTFEQAHLRMSVKGPVDAPVIAGRGELIAPGAEGFAARSADVVFDVPSADNSTATLRFVAAALSGPSPAYAKIFGERVAIEIVGRRTGETIALETARVSSAAVQASASGQVKVATPVALDLAYTVTVPDVAPLAAVADIAARGALHAQGTAIGPITELDSIGQLRLSRALVNGQRLGQVDIAHSTRVAEQISGSARLKMASAEFGAGRASASFHLQDRSVALNRLKVDLLGIKASGALRMPAGAPLPVGALDFTVTSLQPLGRLSGQQLSGHGRGRAQFAARAGGESRLQAELNGVRINELSLQRLQIEGTASGLASGRGSATQRLSLRMDVDEFSDASDTRLRQVTLNAVGSLAELDVTAKLDGAHKERAVSAMLHAVGALDKSVRVLRVDTLQASYGGEPMKLLQPTRISVSADTLQVEDFDLSLPDEGRVHGWFKQFPEAASANLQLANVPLRLLKVLAAVPIASEGAGDSGSDGGRLSGSVIADTRRDAPTLDARLSVSGLRLENAPADTGVLAAQLTAAWDGRELSADLDISGPFEPGIKGRFRVPMALPAMPAAGAPPGAVRSLPVLDFDAAIDAQLDWRGEVEPVIALLPLPDHLLAGIATVALRVAGTLNAPLPSGELTLQNGRYENLLAGTIIDELSLNSDFSNQQRVQFSISGNDGEQGRLQVKGVVRPGNASELLDISAHLERMLVVRVDAATVLSSADLSVKSSARALNVTGNVTVEQAEIRLLNPLPPSIVDLGEVRIEGQPVIAAEDALEGEPVVPVRLDIGIEIPGQTFVRGRGLDSEWVGALRIGGTASAPFVDGRIESKRGVLELIGRAFDLQRGWIVFSGKDTIDPNLDLQLVREANDIVGKILIAGTGSRPTLRFTSTPALAADEVLPRLLFGRSKQSLSGPEAVQLAAGLATLASGEESVMDVARKAIGVDVLRIESAKDGSDSAGELSVGRYATENIYVGAKQALDGRSSSVVVEIELPKNFVVDTEVGQNADGSVGVTWRRDF